MLNRSLKEAYRQLDEAIFRAYRHLYMLGKENNLVPIDLGSITSSSGGSILEIYLTRLGVENGKDVLFTSVPKRKLPGFRHSSLVEWLTKAVRDAFYSFPLLPRLINADAIRGAIVDGISAGFIDYAVEDSSVQLKRRKPNDSLFDDNIKISDDVFILKE